MKCLVPDCDTLIEHDDPFKLAAHIEGFDQRRKEGGTHHVLFRRELGDYMCSECVERFQKKLSANQLTLEQLPDLGIYTPFQPWQPA
jgi:hypothetical protein